MMRAEQRAFSYSVNEEDFPVLLFHLQCVRPGDFSLQLHFNRINIVQARSISENELTALGEQALLK